MEQLNKRLTVAMERIRAAVKAASQGIPLLALADADEAAKILLVTIRDYLRKNRASFGANHPFPNIVCLCGSTRFAEAFNEAAERETLAGKIVVRPEVVTYSVERDPQLVAPAIKERLDELHRRKIDLADEVLVINVGGYIGDSTTREVIYAMDHDKPIHYLEPIQQLGGAAQ